LPQLSLLHERFGTEPLSGLLTRKIQLSLSDGCLLAEAGLLHSGF
jgi:hypothetical protein